MFLAMLAAAERRAQSVYSAFYKPIKPFSKVASSTS